MKQKKSIFLSLLTLIIIIIIINIRSSISIVNNNNNHDHQNETLILKWCPAYCRCQQEPIKVAKKLPAIWLSSSTLSSKYQFEIKQQQQQQQKQSKIKDSIRFRIDCGHQKINDLKQLLLESNNSLIHNGNDDDGTILGQPIHVINSL
ncbi:hypothetical protein DERF_003544 [Dermatophagoides farinae]|uniref:Uncharacterized protein n=1 Tax=Dermatophagoides farinae TaxID=6954 RepID=A0A922LBK5_DERFA|nr:hypothetical protein DERF_003544 [Dermatophagoides farinae]